MKFESDAQCTEKYKHATRSKQSKCNKCAPMNLNFYKSKKTTDCLNTDLFEKKIENFQLA